uniref:Uncharacterized protein LOC105631196 isoform X2 n=1 Tax=Rhizophora mucronata TaxID=61149 RepID=A0A2P2JND9_RHIMU
MASLRIQHQWQWQSSLAEKPVTFMLPKASPFRLSFSLNPSSAESSKPTPENPAEPGPADPLKLAFERAKAYKKLQQDSKSSTLGQGPVEGGGGGSDASVMVGNDENNKRVSVPDSVKAAREKAREYRKNKDVGGGGGEKRVLESEMKAGAKEGNGFGSGSVDKGASKKEKLSISGIDFVGLGFADKKKGKGLPAGLVPVTDPIPAGDLPDVEIIVGDTSKFGDSMASIPKPSQEDNVDLYKPKVSTWGVYPRPGNISKTFGGGRTIRPGDVLETADERAAKDEHTRQLLAAYRKKIGLNIDPKLRYECEKALEEGDSLMNSGKLNEALPYYERVMKNLAFQSELHGLAALQWSICQDSLSRPSDARSMYEKLQSHPNAKVSKKARQFMFSFQVTMYYWDNLESMRRGNFFG